MEYEKYEKKGVREVCGGAKGNKGQSHPPSDPIAFPIRSEVHVS